MGNVFNIQRFCIHDGPGIRTVVFLKGCALHCVWCHNPESQKFEREVLCRTVKCVHCGRCAAVCEEGCHTFEDGKHKFNFEKCTLCEKCVSACPKNALEIVGKEYTVEEVVNEVEKDRIFYETSGGGVTISGGEPFGQPRFLLDILAACKEKGVHTAVETSGATGKENIIASAEVCDLYLFDYKLTDPLLHKKYIGVDNRQILENLALLDEMGKRIILRCPIIPDINDTPEHFAGILQVANAYTHIEAVEIEPYHKLGEGKNEGMGKENYFTSDTPDEEKLQALIREIRPRCRCSVAINK